MIAATTDPTMAARLFRTPVGTASARLLRRRDLLASTPATEGEVDQFLAAFCSGWAQRGHAGPLPDVRAMRKAMHAQDRHLLWLWSLARRSLGRRARDLQVAIAPVLSLGNPGIIGAAKGSPLIVMAETLWPLVMKVVLGAAKATRYRLLGG